MQKIGRSSRKVCSQKTTSCPLPGNRSALWRGPDSSRCFSSTGSHSILAATRRKYHLNFTSGRAGLQAPPFRVKLAGGRAAWADFDKDGNTDLLTVGLGSPVLLYRNLGSRFVDVTASAGLAGVRDVWDARWVDYDGDGYPDLYLLRSGFSGAGQNLLYHNNHDGTFTDVTAAMGLEGERSTASACFADFDGDGRPSLVEVGVSDATHSAVRFFRNSGRRFVEETLQAGLLAGRDGTAVDCAGRTPPAAGNRTSLCTCGATKRFSTATRATESSGTRPPRPGLRESVVRDSVLSFSTLTTTAGRIFSLPPRRRMRSLCVAFCSGLIKQTAIPRVCFAIGATGASRTLRRALG